VVWGPGATSRSIGSTPGHRDVSTTMIYTHIYPSYLRGVSAGARWIDWSRRAPDHAARSVPPNRQALIAAYPTGLICST